MPKSFQLFYMYFKPIKKTIKSIKEEVYEKP